MSTDEITPDDIDRVCQQLADPGDGRSKGRKELAEHCGVSYDAVKRWLNGTRTPSGPATKLIRQILDE